MLGISIFFKGQSFGEGKNIFRESFEIYNKTIIFVDMKSSKLIESSS